MMSRRVKSQWDFGELFPAQQMRRVLSVSELTARIRELLESQVGQVWITGEVTNLRAQASGHIYFTLKDASTQVNCVLFRGEPVAHRELLQDGQKVVLGGEITVYEPRGQYQLRVTAIELQGIGALQLAFERLKKKLAAEGLFEQGRKRSLPRYPQRLGVVTSSSGAALRDVIHVIERRHPRLELVLATCRVQGQGAAEEIACAIRLLNEWNARLVSSGSTPGAPPVAPLDLILITRGGGSLEDLWAFNEEVVARAVFDSALPVISAVGHEIDFTICDFVADVRAATPSAAAEIITEGFFGSRQFVREVRNRLRFLADRVLEDRHETVSRAVQRLGRAHPRRRLDEKLQRLDDLQLTLARCLKYRWRESRAGWQVLAERFQRVRPSEVVKRYAERLEHARQRLQNQTAVRLRERENQFATAEARLRLLSPTSVLERGYSITLDATSGKVIRSPDEVRAGQKLKTRLRRGEIGSVVEVKASRRE
jgi:exodeoxyribonuclease VII large subunit